MAVAAATLADCVPEDLQRRTLARYSFLFSDAALGWLRKWRNVLKRDVTTARHARSCKAAVDLLSTLLDEAGPVRDYLVAKRQPVGAMRADDLEGTIKLWLAVSPQNVAAITKAAIEAYDALQRSQGSIVEWAGLAGYTDAVGQAMPRRDPDYWHIAADTGADLRAYTMPVAQGGDIGRRVAQINDVGAHLDVLLRLAPVLEEVLLYDWLIRSAVILEINTLLDLLFGSPPEEKLNVYMSLLNLCRADRSDEGQTAAKDLQQLYEAIGPNGWRHIRWMRNKISAHLDAGLSMNGVYEYLLELDYQGVVRLAEFVLNYLDEVGSYRLSLKLLLLQERKIRSWPVDQSIPAPGRPAKPLAPASLSNMFRNFDSPYMIITASSLGSPMVAGVTAGRKPQPREKVQVQGRPPNRYFDGYLPYDRLPI